jgi:hypothetical protein
MEWSQGEIQRLYSSGIRLLDLGKNARHFALEPAEASGEHGAPGMQDNIDITREQRQVGAHRGTHPPLDAIAFDSFAEHASGSEANARTGCGTD